MSATANQSINVDYESGIQILNDRSVMSISTVRPDGWPQTTIVKYANDGFTVYFYVDRSSQKYANIERDNRVSLAVGEEPADPSDLQAVYAAAYAFEVTDP